MNPDAPASQGEVILHLISHDVQEWGKVRFKHSEMSGFEFREGSYLNKRVQNAVDEAMSHGDYDLDALVEQLGPEVQRIALMGDVTDAFYMQMEALRRGHTVGQTVARAKLTITEEGVNLLPGYHPTESLGHTLPTDYRKVKVGQAFDAKVNCIQTAPEHGGFIMFTSFLSRTALTGLVDRQGNPRVSLEIASNHKSK